MVHGVGAIQINFIRFFIGGIVMLPFVLKEVKKNTTFDFKDILYFFVLGTLLVPLANTFNQISIEYNSASFATFVFSYVILMQKANKKYGNLTTTALTIIFGTIIFYIYLLFKGIRIFDSTNSGNIFFLL